MTRPMTKTPPMTKLREALDDVAGRWCRSWPWTGSGAGRAMLSDRRSIVAMQEDRSGRPRNRAAAESRARPSGSGRRGRSRRQGRYRSGTGGIGRNRTVRMTTMPTAKNTSRPFFAIGSAVIVSAIAILLPASVRVPERLNARSGEVRVVVKLVRRWDRPRLLRRHARFRVWPLLSPSTGSGVGSGATGPSLSSFNTWRGLPCPASVLALPQGAGFTPATSLGQGLDLWAHHPAAHRCRDRSSTVLPRSSGS